MGKTINGQIEKGASFVKTFSIGSGKSIVLATNATPVVITAYNHGYSNGDTIRILRCNNKGANGTWVIANVDTHTFSLTGSVGTSEGNSGEAMKPRDLTGSTVECQFKTSIVRGSLIDPQPTVTVIDLTGGTIKQEYTPEQTVVLTVSDIWFDVRVTDSLGTVDYPVDGHYKIVPKVTDNG